MAKSKHTAERKIGIVKKYLAGEGSFASLAAAYSIGKSSQQRWALQYYEQGEPSFFSEPGNKHYSKEFKRECVEAVLNGEGSVNDIVAKYKVSSESLLRNWIMKYNANIELKDYEPKREVYMAEADQVIFGPESLGENVRLAFIIKDDAIIELYEEK